MSLPDEGPDDGHHSYWTTIDLPAVLRDHPIGGDFTRFATTISRDALRARQELLFRRETGEAPSTRRVRSR